MYERIIMLNTEEIKTALNLYSNGLSMREISEAIGMNQFTLRRWFLRQGLAIKLHERVIEDTQEESTDEIDVLHHKLSVAEQALIRSRTELNYYRKTIRADVHNKDLHEKVLRLVDDTCSTSIPHDIAVTIHQPIDEYSNHVSILLVSDVHAEEVVLEKNVGALNEYNWEIMESRLDHLFNTWLDAYRGEYHGVVFLMGDIVSGIIHDTLEHTSKPTAEAVHDIAEYLSRKLAAASKAFKELHIGIVSGNHERLKEKPSNTNKGFDFGYLFAQILKAKLSVYSNITFHISTTGFTTLQVGSKSCCAHHGDMFRGPFSAVRTTKIQSSCEAVTGVFPDHIFEGHVHSFSHHNTPTGVSVVNGSVIGPNEYGLTAGFAPNKASQTIIQLTPEGDVEAVRQVML